MIASVATTAGLSAQRSAEGLSPRRGGGGIKYRNNTPSASLRYARPSTLANLCTHFFASRESREISRNIHRYRSYVPSGRKHSAEPTAASLQRGSLRVIRVRQKSA